MIALTCILITKKNNTWIIYKWRINNKFTSVNRERYIYNDLNVLILLISSHIFLLDIYNYLEFMILLLSLCLILVDLFLLFLNANIFIGNEILFMILLEFLTLICDSYLPLMLLVLLTLICDSSSHKLIDEI